MSDYEIPDDIQALATEIAALRVNPAEIGPMDGTTVSGWIIGDIHRSNGSDHKSEWGRHETLCLSEAGLLVLLTTSYQNEFKFTKEEWSSTLVKPADSSDVRVLDNDNGSIDHSGDGRSIETWGLRHGTKKLADFDGIRGALEILRLPA